MNVSRTCLVLFGLAWSSATLAQAAPPDPPHEVTPGRPADASHGGDGGSLISR
jgi:hypothetical protein